MAALSVPTLEFPESGSKDEAGEAAGRGKKDGWKRGVVLDVFGTLTRMDGHVLRMREEPTRCKQIPEHAITAVHTPRS